MFKKTKTRKKKFEENKRWKEKTIFLKLVLNKLIHKMKDNE